MASLPGPERPIRLLGPRLPGARWATAWSASLHCLVFVLAGWATRGGYQPPSALPSERMSRAYAMHYLVLARPPIRESRPERRPTGRLVPVAPAPVTVTTTLPRVPTIAETEARAEPDQSALQVRELSPGTITGIGQVIPTPGSKASPGRGLAGMLGLRVPRPGEVAPPRSGLDRVAELVSGAASACPRLRRPAAWANREVVVAVAFVVDTNGQVDPETLRVIQSPNRPRTENRVHSHIYTVGARVRDDGSRLNSAAYDSLVTREVASHVSDLQFRPALSEGRATRSSVMVSCQTS